MSEPATNGKQKHPVTVFQGQLEAKSSDINELLMGHNIPVQQFIRVALVAAQRNPQLLTADRTSLFIACQQAAHDGLMPDGREGAFVIYGERQGDAFVDKVQWMPMILGIRKRAFKSGALKRWSVDVVRQGDQFHYRLGSDPMLHHVPSLDGRGMATHFWSLALTQDGETLIDVMDLNDVMRIKARSRTGAKGKGPWVTDFDEMGKKTVARRHSKQIPLSSDLHDLLRRDDAMYDTEPEQSRIDATQRASIGSRLDRLAIGRSYAPAIKEDTFDVRGDPVPVSRQSSDAGEEDDPDFREVGDTQALPIQEGGTGAVFQPPPTPRPDAKTKA